MLPLPNVFIYVKCVSIRTVAAKSKEEEEVERKKSYCENSMRRNDKRIISAIRRYQCECAFVDLNNEFLYGQRFGGDGFCVHEN